MLFNALKANCIKSLKMGFCEEQKKSEIILKSEVSHPCLNPSHETLYVLGVLLIMHGLCELPCACVLLHRNAHASCRLSHPLPKSTTPGPCWIKVDINGNLMFNSNLLFNGNIASLPMMNIKNFTVLANELTVAIDAGCGHERQYATRAICRQWCEACGEHVTVFEDDVWFKKFLLTVWRCCTYTLQWKLDIKKSDITNYPI